MFRERQAVIVWLYNLKQARFLRKYGNVHYVSKRLKYAVLYCNMDEINTLMQQLEELTFVKSIDISAKPFIKTEYDTQKADREKDDEYKILQ